MMLAEFTWPQFLLGLVIFMVCFFLIVVILLQRGRGGGLAGAFGGGGGSGTFGAKTGDVFTWITVSFTSVFLLLAIFANFVFDRSEIALATPTVSQPIPGTESAPGTPVSTQDAQPITIPLEPGMDPKDVAIDLITRDGQVIPTDIPVEVVEEPAPGAPGNQPPPSESTPGAQSDAPGDADSEGGTSDSGSDASNDDEKEPG